MNTHLLFAAIALAGAVSAGLYLRRRQFIDAALVLVATGALGLLGADLRVPGEAGRTLTIDPAAPPLVLDGVNALRLEGDGLRGAAWNDLPALPLMWDAPRGGAIRLEFPDRIALGRMFTLTVAREDKGDAKLALLAENGQVIAEASGSGDLRVDWMPPVAERLVLRARVTGADDQVISEGPVPFVVEAPALLHIAGRFGAPSFDLRVLNDILAGSGALLDWQVQLGRNLSRSETAREEMAAPNLMIVDAARIERMGASERTALLKRVADGLPLLVLGGNANDSGIWSRTLQLPLRAQPAGSKVDQPFELPLAPLLPASKQAGPWRSSDGVLWTRDWQQGRIAWLGATEWHRHAIAEPRALALWWQGVLDRVGVEREQETEWLAQREMPLPGQRLEVCARGVQGEVRFPQLKTSLAWQQRQDRLDAACVALWPQQGGWLEAHDQKAGTHPLYVYASGDWPQWQAAMKRDATLRYTARTHGQASAGPTRPMPAWPFALVFAAAMLLLWWRERR